MTVYEENYGTPKSRAGLVYSLYIIDCNDVYTHLVMDVGNCLVHKEYSDS